MVCRQTICQKSGVLNIKICYLSHMVGKRIMNWYNRNNTWYPGLCKYFTQSNCGMCKNIILTFSQKLL